MEQFKFKDIEYVRPDFDAIKKDLREYIDALKKAASFEEIKRLFLEQNKKDGEFSTMFTVASIRNTLNLNDEFYDKEMQYIREENAKLIPLEKELSETILKLPFRKELEEEFGSLYFKDIEEKKRLLSEDIIEDTIEEGKLTQAYQKTAGKCKTVFRGEECNFYGLLKHMQSTDREERKEAFKAWADLYESASAELDDEYVKLVAIRDRKAKKLGFKSYTEMAYLSRSRYDYNAEDVAGFRKQVVDVIVPVVAGFYEAQRKRIGVDKLHYYDEFLCFPDGNAMPHGTKDEMVAAAKEMYRELSKETGEYFDFMTEHELFDLDTRPGKHLGGYCTFLEKYKAPFIFSNFNGTSADVDVLTHEAGHAFEAYVASRVQPLSSLVWSTSEINEIHSMSMELFTHPWMEKFFGEKADKYRFYHLVDALSSIPYLCAVDEYQHLVYAKPEADAAEHRKMWQEVEKKFLPWRDYDGNEFLEGGGFWMQKQHIFLYPFYYVDYALAQLCAFDLFGLSLENKEEAWNNYMTLLRLGGSRGYFETLETAHIRNPFKEGNVEKIVASVVKEIEKMKF
ncbi:MAG: M3 family oligoendopeptidase [Lachnospiraceae bacterium]|nr:M3 family oligoendopeptidase [Lachnospiraceae bacterium]